MSEKPSETTFIICNPTAGGGQGLERWEHFKQELEERGLPFELQISAYPGHASEIAGSLVDGGYRRIGVFGGDGTINEVVNGVMKRDPSALSRLEFVFLAAGSSCDFDKKFPKRSSHLERFTSQTCVEIDLGKVECRGFDGAPAVRYFVNNSSVGVVSLANEKFNSAKGLLKKIKRVNVDAAAIVAGVGAVLGMQPLHCDLCFDDEVLEGVRVSNLTVFKTRHFGGGMHYGVETDQSDGRLHIVYADAVTRARLLTIIPALYGGTVLERKEAHHRVCTVFELRAQQDMMVEMDGEFGGYPPARYTVLHKALRVVV